MTNTPKGDDVTPDPGFGLTSGWRFKVHPFEPWQEIADYADHTAESLAKDLQEEHGGEAALLLESPEGKRWLVCGGIAEEQA